MLGTLTFSPLTAPIGAIHGFFDACKGFATLFASVAYALSEGLQFVACAHAFTNATAASQSSLTNLLSDL